MNFLHSARVSALMVALNIITCFFLGDSMKMDCTSFRMSILSRHLSHSSKTKCCNLSNFKSFSLSSPSILPGVPIRTCGQESLSISLSVDIGVPP
eukprot:Skav207203  [mRNA]  locus=scaffold2886:17138:18946:+ [translate_table: standard]